MAKLDWAVVCDHAYFDRTDQLCIVSILRDLPAPRLPLVLPHLMFVGKLTELQMIEQFDVTVGVITPEGAVLCADADSDLIAIQLVRDYVVVTLRSVPFTHEGVYAFRMQIADADPVTIEVPVTTAERARGREVVH